MNKVKVIYDYIIMSNFFEPFITCEIRFNDKTNENDIYVIYANRYFPSITGVQNDMVINKRIEDLLPQKLTTVFNWTQIIANAAMTNNYKVIEQYFDCINKYLKLFVFGYNNGIFHIIIEDVTYKKQLKRIMLEKDRQISYLAEEVRTKNDRDNLTKLYNFQFALDSMESSIDYYNEDNTNFSVLLLDLLDLKKINLDYSYRTADKILIELASTIMSNTRKIDVSARMDGDKFIVIYNNVNSDVAKVLIDRLKIDIKRNILINDTEEIYINGATVDYSGQSRKEIMVRLDEKLKKAKSLGRDIIL